MEASTDLIARARTSRTAFGELYWHYSPKVYRYFLAHTGNHHDSEDLTAQTFEQVLRTIDRYEDRGNRFSTWLLTVASHILLGVFHLSWDGPWLSRLRRPSHPQLQLK